MYRMLAVDDEQIVLDSMEFIIHAEFDGTIELHTARSGREAIEIAEEINFDIIFIDLKMPGINGIEASKEIKMRNKDVNIVFITAYEIFDFAKEAIQIGVHEYLLKPVTKDRVIILLNQIIMNIEISKGKRKEHLLLQEKFQNVLPVLESSFINALLLTDTGSNKLEKYKELLEIDEDSGYIISVELLAGEQLDVSDMCVDLGFKDVSFFESIYENIKKRYRCLASALTVNRIVFFIPCGDDDNEYNQRVAAITLGEYIKKKIIEQIGINSICIGIGCCFKGMENIIQSYEESLMAIRHNNGSGLLHIMDIEQNSVFKRNYPIVREKQLLKNISLVREYDAVQDFNFIFNWLVEEYGKNNDTIKAKIYELDILLNRLLWDYPEKSENFPIRVDDPKGTDNIALVSEMRIWFIRRIKAVINFIRTEKSTHESTVIKKVKTFILENYMDEISQSDVARRVNISPHYLSKLFKDETEISFIEYLTSVRLDKAKELLKCGFFSIKEVCFRVGYTDPNYFSRLFKKVVGIPPTQYKDEEISWEPGKGIFVVPEQQENEDKSKQQIRIGLSMASVYEDRWKKDKEAFLKKADELKAEVFVKLADNDCEKQIQQVRTLLQKGIDVLVIIPQNSEKMGRVIADAKCQGVKVISYCRLIMNADIDMYIAFDGIRIGELMAEIIVDEVPMGKYLIVNGSQSDYNSQMYNQGIKNVLQDYINNDRIEIVDEIWAEDWQPKEALHGVEGVITRDANIDAIICGNDSLAEAVIQVLIRYNLAGTIKVTGHDADFSGFQHTLDGTQLMTVYTSFESLAAQAAGYAIKLAKGQEIKTHWSIFNGIKNVPYHKKQPIAVTRDNINEIMQVSGYYKHEENVKNVQ